MALAYGEDLNDITDNKITVQQIYDENYNFARPPEKTDDVGGPRRTAESHSIGMISPKPQSIRFPARTLKATRSTAQRMLPSVKCSP